MFAVGDMFWLSGKNIPIKRPSKKSDNRFYGLYPVVEQVGRQAYLLSFYRICDLNQGTECSLKAAVENKKGAAYL